MTTTLTIQERIKGEPEFAVAALMFLYSCQTRDEQNAGFTAHLNDIGFNACDSEILSSFAVFYRSRGYLTEKQLALCIRKLQKYHRQIPEDLEPLPIKSYQPKSPRPQAPASPKTAELDKEKAGRIWIRFDWDAQLVSDVKTRLHDRMFEKRNGSGAGWSAKLSLENVQSLLDLGFPLTPNLMAWFESKTAPAPDHIDIPGLLGTLRPFQDSGVAFIETRNGRAFIGDEMGLGKTVQALAYLQLHPDFRPAVIVVPASLKLNWQREAEKWLADPQVEQVEGRTPYFIKGKIIVINYDILPYWEKQLKKMKPSVVIFDEVHYAKNPKTKRSKACLELSQAAPHCIALSGTPITNRPIEFFTPIQLVDPDLYPDFWAFARKYCNARRNGYGWDFSGASNTKELNAQLTKSILLRRLKVDVAKELPPKTRVVVPMELENRNAYQAAQDNFIKWLWGKKGEEAAKKAMTAEALVRIEHLKQLAYTGKINACIEWIEDFLSSGEKLVVFGVHHKCLDDLAEAFEGQCVKVDGRTAKPARQAAVDAFQKDPEIRLFLGNIKAAGVGLTLTAASCTAFVEIGWTPGEHDQAEDRVHRIGQTADSVTAYYLLADRTVEEEIAELLDEKRVVLTAVLDGQDVDESSMLSALLARYSDENDEEAA